MTAAPHRVRIGLLVLGVLAAWPVVAMSQGKKPERTHLYSNPSGSGDDGYGFLGQKVGRNQKFVLAGRGKRHADIVATIGARHLRMPDERIVEPDNAAPKGEKPETVLEPAQTWKAYDFYLSPDEKWLFVERGGFRRFAVCYLYRRASQTRMVPVHPGGMRLDNAVITRYARLHHLRARTLRGGARNAGFIKWDMKRHRLHFWLYACSSWYPEDKENRGAIRMNANVTYDLRTGAISLDTDETAE